MARNKFSGSSDGPEDGSTQETDPIEVVDLDAAIQSETLTPEESQSGVSFWFGEVGMIHLGNGEKYHATRRHAFITDPKLIEQLKNAAKNPSHKIFIE